MKTTSPPPVHIESIIPELKALKRPCVRLHPRAQPKLPRDVSKVGGEILWPDSEPWPECGWHHGPLIPVLQIWKRDAPALPFPEGTDLFQLLWCPNPYCTEIENGPLVHAAWWHGDQVADCDTSPPAPDDHNSEFMPVECAVYPETVDEYPPFECLPEHLQDRIESRPELDRPDPYSFYNYSLSIAPGTKIGTFPCHMDFPDERPECHGCGLQMAHLLTVSSSETFDEQCRWRPIEDQDQTGGLLPGVAELGGGGDVVIFACGNCQQREARSYLQS